ncbi:integrase/recombinase XerC [Kushneria avicenniae]|uniref:Tyrosine recombinase XerC n=1 Tax=Kushneria avicenniae TaxID=402385 RepID=A0A1I1J6X4_9GAMM|nr:tyrosine recombinase XerC [Kushneria avicenniae]SFC44359.1 integrase/recombinase XerC [Kushneria avicenniae]
MSALLPLVETFIERLRHRHSPATIDAYRRDLAALMAFMDREEIPSWDALDMHHLRRFLGRERTRGLAARSLARRQAAIRRFCDLLVEQNLLSHNPARLLDTPKMPRHLPRPVDVDVLGQFLDTPHDGSPLALRDQAMLELCYSSGLRLAELAGIDLSDIDAQRARVRGKGDKPRQVPIGRRAATALADWLKVRGMLAGPHEPALFVSTRGQRLGHRAIQLRMAHLGRERGLPEHLHPHRLRHSFASHLLESSQDLRAVQELLGHAHLSTTQVYTRLDWQHLADTFDRAHPRAHRRPGTERHSSSREAAPSGTSDNQDTPS